MARIDQHQYCKVQFLNYRLEEGMRQSSVKASETTSDPEHPRQSRGLHRRAEIMLAAEDVFIEHGYANTTMDAVAARAGASKATFYKHFGSKEALFADIVHSRVPDITAASNEMLHCDRTLQAVLVEWGLKILERVTAPRAVALYKLIISELPRSPELARIFYAQGPVAVRQQLSDFLRTATNNRQLRCHDPDHAAILLTSLITTHGFEQAVFGQTDAAPYGRSPKDHVEEAVAMFLAHYRV
jgi:TetR/AcrR family transcriptional regulator, mexJK operon transcriptional repressor